MTAPAPRISATAPPGPSMTPITSGYAEASELEKYRLITNIGKGSFGVISKVQRIDDGKEFAMKQLDYSKMTDKDRKQILAEVAILDSLKHRNIVQLIQKIKDPKNERIYIIMEFCTSGDLGTLIRKAQRSGQPLHEDKIWNIFLQITQALHHCHWPAERGKGRASGNVGITNVAGDTGAPRYQVLHRDLKPENVFLSDDFVKLGDFGLSKDMGGSAFTSTYVGTPLYMPPEILAENRYDTKSDIWSLGCLVFEMCALVSPFSTAQTQTELITMVKSGKLPPLPAHISPALKAVVRAMLTLNPARRPSTSDLLEMDEMKLHRKLFTVQNQTSLLLSKRDELKGFEDRLYARSAALDEREKAIAAREASVQAREYILASKDEENKDTQRRLNAAAEQLRGHWDKLREEKEKDKEGLGLGLPGMNDERSRRSSAVPTRPVLEERHTTPLPAVSRFPRALGNHPSYGPADTPSKIPQITPLRRNATKSLGNLAAQNRIDAAMAATATAEATPAKQTIGLGMRRGRTSIGSPSELAQPGGGAGGGNHWCEDVTMASPAISSFASPGTFIPRPRRSSIVPSSLVLGAYPSTSTYGTSSSESQSETSSNGGSSTDSHIQKRDGHALEFPPTMIPGPVFQYREAATPAKWGVEDPDLPSPFLRRGSSIPAGPNFGNGVGTGAGERAILGAINVQAAVGGGVTAGANKMNSAKMFGGIGMGGTGPGGMMGNGGAGPASGMPRSKSGNLHQHVLRANAVAVGVGGGGGAGASAGVRGVMEGARVRPVGGRENHRPGAI